MNIVHFTTLAAPWHFPDALPSAHKTPRLRKANKQSICPTCGAAIVFAITAGGYAMAINAEQTVGGPVRLTEVCGEFYVDSGPNAEGTPHMRHRDVCARAPGPREVAV